MKATPTREKRVNKQMDATSQPVSDRRVRGTLRATLDREIGFVPLLSLRACHAWGGRGEAAGAGPASAAGS